MNLEIEIYEVNLATGKRKFLKPDGTHNPHLFASAQVAQSALAHINACTTAPSYHVIDPSDLQQDWHTLPAEAKDFGWQVAQDNCLVEPCDWDDLRAGGNSERVR